MDNEYLNKEEQAKLDEAAQQKVEQKIKKNVTPKKNRKPNAFVQILNGDFLNKEFMLTNFNFIFFILFLLMLIVGKGYYGKQLIDDVNDKETKYEDISSDFVEKKARLQEETRRGSLDESLNGTGLKQTQNPTKVIRVSK